MRGRHQAFCDHFIQLFCAAVSAGVEHPRVATDAALLAGYGGRSWCAQRQRQAASNAALRILRLPAVRAYMAEKGLIYGWYGWAVAPAASEQGEIAY
jgi:hypothetical protein